MDIPQVSFTKGEVSPIAAARTDASFYANAVATCVNFFVRAEGAVSNRPGLQYVATCASATPNGSYIIPFIYNNVQSYVAEFAAGTITMYANGALIESGIVNPYQLADLPNLRWAQSADVLDVCVQTQPPYQLTRNSITSFSFASPQVLNGPFQDINTDGTTTMYASGTQGTVTITCSSPMFTPQHVGAVITIQEQFLDSIIPWEANKLIATNNASPVGLYCRSDGKIYQCVAALTASGSGGSGDTATGTFQPVHTSGTQYDGNGGIIAGIAGVAGVGWQFVSTDAGSALITGYTDAHHVTAVIQNFKGVWSNFPPTVVGGPNTVHGPYTYSGNGTTKTFSSLTGITTGDPNQFYVTVGGLFQDPTTYSINLAGTSITFNQAPGAGTNNIVITQCQGTLGNLNNVGTPITMTGLCLSTLWALGSFSSFQGFPSTVVYFNDRKVYAGTTLEPQTVWTSQTSVYEDFGVSNPQVDTDGITFTINARRENPICDLIPLNDLLIGTASTIWRVTHSAAVGAITPTDISLLPQNFYGEQSVPSVQTGDTVIYVQWGGRKIRDLAYQFQYDKFVGGEITVYARQMFPYGTTATRMAFAPEPYGLLFVVRSDGVMCVCAYLPEQQVTAWSRYATQGFFEDVCVVPENGTYAVYVIVRRVVNGATVRYIERFAAREAATVDDYFFVDSGLTYDGRNTSAVTMMFSTAFASVAIQNIQVSFRQLVQLPVLITTAAPHGLSAGQAVDIYGVNATGYYQINGTQVVLAVPNNTQFTIQPVSTTVGTYSGGGNVLANSALSGNSGSLTASSATGWAGFQSSDVTNGNAIWIYDASGTRCRLQITGVANSTLATVLALDPIPADLMTTPTLIWTFAKTNFSGLTNLVGATVSVQADGAVLAQQVVNSSGAITLSAAGGVVHAGLPYVSQLQSMNFNIQGQETIRNKNKTLPRLSAVVDTSGLFMAGPSFDNLTESQSRQYEPYGVPTYLHTGVVHVQLPTFPSDDASVCMQMSEPAPLTVLSWIVDVDIGEAG